MAISVKQFTSVSRTFGALTITNGGLSYSDGGTLTVNGATNISITGFGPPMSLQGPGTINFTSAVTATSPRATNPTTR